MVRLGTPLCYFYSGFHPSCDSPILGVAPWEVQFWAIVSTGIASKSTTRTKTVQVQFVLGVATSFNTTTCFTLFLHTKNLPTSVYSTRHLSSAEDKNFLFCPQLRTQKTYGKQTLLSKPSTMAYLTMVVLPSWQLLTQYYTN